VHAMDLSCLHGLWGLTSVWLAFSWFFFLGEGIEGWDRSDQIRSDWREEGGREGGKHVVDGIAYRGAALRLN
jgi:hypothetical protein